MSTHEDIKETINGLVDLLGNNGYDDYVKVLERGLVELSSGDYTTLISNDIWGGAGSLADQAFVDEDGQDSDKKSFKVLMGNLGEQLSRVGEDRNPRISFWVKFFRNKKELGSE